MQNENSRLKIHTSVRPVPEAEKKQDEPVTEAQNKEAQRESLPKLRMRRRGSRSGRKTGESGECLTVGERLLRNSAVACALLLTVMALRNVDQPWTRQATEGIRQAMTMRVDWDETLGKLSFVRALVPDTALVFLNMDDRIRLCTPVSGVVSHEYTEQQPWLEYSCQTAQPVYAAMQGTVTAAGRGAGDEWIVLIQGDEGTEAVYGYLTDVYVQPGQRVEAGEQIGATADLADGRMYFELREEGTPVDPSGYMR